MPQPTPPRPPEPQPPDPPQLPDRPLTYALAMQSVAPRIRGFRVWCDTGYSGPRFFQIINRLIDDPTHCQAEPIACNRLRALREKRRSQLDIQP